LKKFSSGSPYNRNNGILIKEKKIETIGADIVELAPELDHSKSPVFTGKVLREMLICMGS
jgi:arginase family enzyme